MLYVDYFSPTGGVEKLVIAKAMQVKGECVNESVLYRSFTKPTERKLIDRSFLKEDILILGLPVYAGRVPNLLLDFLTSYSGNQTPVYLVFGYGNRHFDDAPKEAYRLFKERGFVVKEIICAVCEHSFSSLLAKAEPNSETLDFIKKVKFSIKSDSFVILNPILEKKKIEIFDLNLLEDQNELRSYYRPVDTTGQPFNFIKIKPVTNASCIACGLCVNLCPMGAISALDFTLIAGKCIKCCACVKGCPVSAKTFDDENFLKHKKELEDALIEVDHPITIFTRS